MSLSRTIIRIYALLLKLYPRPFRLEFEEEMQTVFAAQVIDQAEDGKIHLVATCLFELFDLLPNLIYQYWVVIRKEFGMDHWLYEKFHNHLIGWGSLVFGLAYGLEMLFSSLTGLNSIGVDQYTALTLLATFFTQFLFIVAATGFFWLGTPRRISKWSFLPSVIAAGLMNLLMLIFSIAVLWNPQVSNDPASGITLLPWPELFTILWSLIFGGLFGWAYQGWRGVLPFALVTILSKIIRYGLAWVMAVVLNIGISPIANPWLQSETLIWPLAFVILGGMVFGALLGWEADQVNRKGSPNRLAA